MIVTMPVTPLIALSTIHCSPLNTHLAVCQSLWWREATSICQNIVLIQPTECSAGLDLCYLSLLAPFSFSFPVTFLFFFPDPNRHLSQALVVSLHAAANSPPSATIPTVGSSFLWAMEEVWETLVPSTKPQSWTQPFPLQPQPLLCKPGETQQGPNGWSM